MKLYGMKLVNGSRTITFVCLELRLLVYLDKLLFGLLNPEDGGSALYRKAGNCSVVDIA